jgi:hypothetical protein
MYYALLARQRFSLSNENANQYRGFDSGFARVFAPFRMIMALPVKVSLAAYYGMHFPF